MILSPKQLDVWRNADARWNVLVGAVSSGKTHGSYYLKAKRMRSLPPGNSLLVGKTIRTYSRNVLDPMREIFGAELVSPVHGDGTVELFGRKCYIVGANDERSLTKIQGLSLVYVDGDEFVTWPESFLQMLKSRLRQPGACADLTANPDNPHHWAKKFIDETQGLKYWHFTLEDNPFLEPSYVESIKNEYSGVWYQRLILGQWVAAEGAIYDMLDESVHVVDELPKTLDGNPGFTKYIVGVDYGTGSVTTFWLLGIGIDGKLYFIDHWRWDVAVKHAQRTDLQFVQDLDNWLKSLNVRADIVVPADAQSFMVQLRQKRAELQSVTGLAWADRSPGSVLDGIRDVGSLLQKQMLFFSRKIQRDGGLGEWVGYVWDAKASERGEDAPVKAHDHSPDAGRYAVSYAKKYWLHSLRKAA